MIGVAIDPGLRGCGLAIFSGFGTLENGDLIHASYVKNSATSGNSFDACRQMADIMRRSLNAALSRSNPSSGVPQPITVLWGEVPVSYKAGSQKGDQNDLIHVGAFMYAISCLPNFDYAQLIRYSPRDWKGTIAKGEAEIELDGSITSSGMLRRITERLRPEEDSKIIRAGALTHNIIDAIGIGLKGTGRLEQRRVYGVI